MNDFEQRLIQEAAELSEKIKKLSTFMLTRNFSELPKTQKSLLLAQLAAMDTYRIILFERIEDLGFNGQLHEALNPEIYKKKP